MNKIRLLTPGSAAQALNMLEEYANFRTFVLAGGTDLIPKMKDSAFAIDYLVDITGLGFDQIAASEDKIIIGATCTFKQICLSDLVWKHLPALAAAAKSVGAVQTRALATVGGNVCAAVPSLDSAPVLMIYDASVRLVSSGGERYLPVDEFFLAPREVALKRGEILTEFVIPRPSVDFRAYFIKLGRRSALSLSIVNAALGAGIRDGKIFNARGAIGACAPTPVRLSAAEEYLNGKNPAALNFAILDDLVKSALKPISDLRASAEYRSDMAAALTRKNVRAVLEVAE